MNDIRLDRKGLSGNISWYSIGKFLVREWRTVILGLALLAQAGWTHIGQARQDKSITALQRDDAEFKKAVAHCLVDERKR